MNVNVGQRVGNHAVKATYMVDRNTSVIWPRNHTGQQHVLIAA